MKGLLIVSQPRRLVLILWIVCACLSIWGYYAPICAAHDYVAQGHLVLAPLLWLAGSLVSVLVLTAVTVSAFVRKSTPAFYLLNLIFLATALALFWSIEVKASGRFMQTFAARIRSEVGVSELRELLSKTEKALTPEDRVGLGRVQIERQGLPAALTRFFSNPVRALGLMNREGTKLAAIEIFWGGGDFHWGIQVKTGRDEIVSPQTMTLEHRVDDGIICFFAK